VSYDIGMELAGHIERELQVPLKYVVAGLLCASTIALLDVHSWVGWLGLAAASALAGSHWRTAFGRHMLLLAALLGLLAFMPVSTNIDVSHILFLPVLILITVVTPFLVTRKVFRDRVMAFPFRRERTWYTHEVLYVLATGVLTYLVFPVYFTMTGAYLNWSVDFNLNSIGRLFVGMMGVGVWDELFFIGTVFALLRKHLPFTWANIAQATIFTAFLYDLGFRGWGPAIIFGFALSQAYIYRRSKSFLYIVSIHLTIDFVLFLILVHLHHPAHWRFFVTSPW